MNLSLIKAYHAQAEEAERFWHSAYEDAEAGRGRAEYSWLWLHYRRLRERFEAMLAARGCEVPTEGASSCNSRAL